MRFVSKILKYSHGIRPETYEFIAVPGGRTDKRVIERGLEALFEPQGLTAYEVEVGLKNLTHTGLPEDRDTEAEVTARPRLSLFDSEAAQRDNGWTDDEREIVEQELLASSAHGIEFVHVPTPKRPLPWPGYDNLSPSQIISAIEDGLVTVDIDEVLAYERENDAREEVFDALVETETEQDVVVQA